MTENKDKTFKVEPDGVVSGSVFLAGMQKIDRQIENEIHDVRDDVALLVGKLGFATEGNIAEAAAHLSSDRVPESERARLRFVLERTLEAVAEREQLAEAVVAAHVKELKEDKEEAESLWAYYDDLYEQQQAKENSLRAAAGHKHAQALEKTLEEIYDRDDMIGVLHGNTSLISGMIERGESLDRQTRSGNTLLDLSIHTGNSAAIDLLIDNGADINRQNKRGYTPLMRAARKGDVATVKKIIATESCDLHAVNMHGRTALEEARKFGRQDVAECLSCVMEPQNAGIQSSFFSMAPTQHASTVLPSAPKKGMVPS